MMMMMMMVTAIVSGNTPLPHLPVPFNKRRLLHDAQQRFAAAGLNLLAVLSHQHGMVLVELVLEVADAKEVYAGLTQPLHAERVARVPVDALDEGRARGVGGGGGYHACLEGGLG